MILEFRQKFHAPGVPLWRSKNRRFALPHGRHETVRTVSLSFHSCEFLLFWTALSVGRNLRLKSRFLAGRVSSQCGVADLVQERSRDDSVHSIARFPLWASSNHPR